VREAAAVRDTGCMGIGGGRSDRRRDPPQHGRGETPRFHRRKRAHAPLFHTGV